ncbi:MAG: nucleotide sugar dehydrogenase, partial [Planctomycetaceae bacterium]
MSSSLEERIRDRSAVVGIIGLGYVGLPLMLAFVKAGFRTIGFDVDQAKVDMLQSGQSYIRHIDAATILQLIADKQFEPTADLNRLSEPDCLLICVPTPLTGSRDPDLSFVEGTTRAISRVLRPGQLIVLESTTYPTTTREVMLPILEDSGLKAGEEFFLAYSPEREDPGNPDFSAAGIPKVVGGLDDRSCELAAALYAHAIVQIISVSSLEIAEACKILENTYRAVNIALVNELKVLFDRMGIDVWEVIDAAKTKPFGFQAFYPGPGLGGHCIPIDPFYLTWLARKQGLTTRFIELAGEVNSRMPEYVISRLMEFLNEEGRALKGSRVCVLGV